MWHHVLAHQSDRLGRVGAERATEVDVSDTKAFHPLNLFNNLVGCSADRQPKHVFGYSRRGLGMAAGGD